MKVYAGLDPRLSLRDVGAYARRVEALGYDGLHVAETVHDAFAVALLAAQRTTRLTVRTSVALAFIRSPTLVAYNAWDLSAFSAGRFELGLGTQIRQNVEDRFAMAWSEPVARMRDYLGALDALYECFRTGDKINYESEHYTLTRMQPYFNPGPDDTTAIPPTWLGGVNALMCELAGERAAGFVTHPTNSTPRYLESLCIPHLHAGAQRAGRAVDAVQLVAGTQVITGATPAELDGERERQRQLFAFLYSTPAYRRTLELYGWESLAGELQQLIRAERWSDLRAVISDEMLETIAPSAVYDDLPSRLLDRYAALTDGILLAPPPDPRHDDAFVHVIATLQAG